MSIKRGKQRSPSRRKNRINKVRYALKEKVAFSKNIFYADTLDNQPALSEKELDDIIQKVVETGNPEEPYEPFIDDIIPKGRNRDKTKKLYYRRKYYRDYAFPRAMPEGSQNIMDPDVPDDDSKYQGNANKVFAPFQHEDMIHRKTFYGRLDTKNYSIYPDPTPNRVLKLVNGTENVFLVNFVCDALNDMMEKINTLKNSGKLPRTSAYFQFKVHRGWQSFVSGHEKMVKAIFEAYVSNWATDVRRFSKITNFRTFSEDFVSFLSSYLSRMPLTRANMVIHRSTSPMISGIMFEISKAMHDEDEKKYSEFIKDDYFLTIQNIANGYGFMIDKNAPWRFIADLESPQMRERMAELGFDTLQEMFDAQYYRAHLYEVNSLREYTLAFYDSFVESYPYYSVYTKCGDGTKAKLLYREARPKNPFDSGTSYGDRKLLEYYYLIRARESFKDWNQEEFDFEVETAWQIFKEFGFVAALDYVNDKTSLIIGRGANFGNKEKMSDGKRIIYNHQPSYKRSSFTMKF